MTTGFHEVQFPVDISLNSKGGPERKTDIVTLRSGAEQRNAIWADARRKYQAGYGVKTFGDAQKVILFFEERRGRLYGFRWKDHFDFTSSAPSVAVSPLDQTIGNGNGSLKTFQLIKTYGALFAPWTRTISKPVAGSVRVAVGGAETGAFTVDTTTGLVTLTTAPSTGIAVSAGFQFDVPVRFDTDYLEFNMDGPSFGAFPNVPIMEIRV